MINDNIVTEPKQFWVGFAMGVCSGIIIAALTVLFIVLSN